MSLIQDFPTALINEAQKWLGCRENKNTPNRSACVDQIKSYGGGEPTNEPWCAQYVSMVLDRTCIRFAALNPLIKSKSTIALKNDAEKKNIAVDRVPSPGSIFFKYRDSGGHVGFVVEVNGNQFKTIEGNINDKVDWGKRNLTTEKYYFIHIEQRFSGKKIIAGLDPIYYIAGAAATGYYLLKRTK
jgi:uncharacterized protein (TIGR02594 family)